MKKMVSIVLPVFNGSKYLSQSIESIIKQSYDNWELIIINDCSTDNSLEIANHYASLDKRIRVFSNEKNMKLPNSLNIGFGIAQGSYFTWTSDDNLFKEDALKIMLQEIERTNASFVYADYSIIDEFGNDIKDINLPDSKRIVAGNVVGACFLYTSDIAKKVGLYDERLYLAEDYDYWLRIFRSGKVYHISSNLYSYRIHSNSLTETRKKEIRIKTYEVLEKHFLFLHKLAKDSGQRIDFYDFFLKNTSGEDKYNTLKLLISVERWYAIFLKIRKIKKIFNRKMKI